MAEFLDLKKDLVSRIRELEDDIHDLKKAMLK
jgi:hypothetical protein